MMQRLEEVVKELELSTAAMKRLQSEKDELEGVIQNIKEEREMLKVMRTQRIISACIIQLLKAWILPKLSVPTVYPCV